MATKKEVKKLDKDLVLAIDWAAAEYKYVVNLKDELAEVKGQKSKLRKAIKILRYIGRAERRAFRYEEVAEKGLKEILQDLSTHLGHDFSSKHAVIDAMRNVIKEIDIEHDTLLKYASRYEGVLAGELEEAKLKASLEKKEPDKAEQIHASLLQLIDHVQEQISEIEKWVRALEASLQKAREILKQLPDERRYIKNVLKIKLAKPGEVVDIHQTPLLFRKDQGIVFWLDFERRRKIVSEARTVPVLYGDTAYKAEIYLEMPLPYLQRPHIGSWKYRFTSLDSEHDDLYRKFMDRYPSITEPERIVLTNFLHENPNIDPDTLLAILRETTKIAFGQDGKGRVTGLRERQRFLQNCARDQKVLEIWLTLQKLCLGPVRYYGKSKWYTLVTEFGANSAFAKRRNNTFLISPRNYKLFTIPSTQGHGDFMFELLALDDIPTSEIVGYIEYPNKSDTVYDSLDGRGDYVYRGEGIFNMRLIEGEEELEKIVARLKKFFPFAEFSKESINRDAAEAIATYIKDKFKLDPKTTTMKTFVETIVKLAGIPIYSLDGKLLWPT